MNLLEICQNAKKAVKNLREVTKVAKNEILIEVAAALITNKREIIVENEKDLANGKNNNMSKALLDRLQLTDERIESMALSLRQIAELADPIGKVLSMDERPNGMIIGKKVVPIGVIGIIYEARPNVTVDAFGLCFKTGNVVVLRGGKEALNSNIKLVEIINQVFIKRNIDPNCLQILTDISRETANQFMKMDKYLDLLIPRGGAGLINTVVQNSTVPIIQTGVGNCHTYIDKYADLSKAVNIAYNAKAQRPGVCNSCETILVHKDIKDQFLPLIAEKFKGIVEIRGDKTVRELIDYATEVTVEDYQTEFHDYIVAIRVVDSLNEAIAHIEQYTTYHSEAIITDNYPNAQKFLNDIDAAAVYVNASTRLTDGFEFGFGAEIGISTQKLHARGPMGLEVLTSTKYIIYGNGQIK